MHPTGNIGNPIATITQINSMSFTSRASNAFNKISEFIKIKFEELHRLFMSLFNFRRNPDATVITTTNSKVIGMLQNNPTPISPTSKPLTSITPANQLHATHPSQNINKVQEASLLSLKNLGIFFTGVALICGFMNRESLFVNLSTVNATSETVKEVVKSFGKKFPSSVIPKLACDANFEMIGTLSSLSSLAHKTVQAGENILKTLIPEIQKINFSNQNSFYDLGMTQTLLPTSLLKREIAPLAPQLISNPYTLLFGGLVLAGVTIFAARYFKEKETQIASQPTNEQSNKQVIAKNLSPTKSKNKFDIKNYSHPSLANKNVNVPVNGISLIDLVKVFQKEKIENSKKFRNSEVEELLKTYKDSSLAYTQANNEYVEWEIEQKARVENHDSGTPLSPVHKVLIKRLEINDVQLNKLAAVQLKKLEVLEHEKILKAILLPERKYADLELEVKDYETLYKSTAEAVNSCKVSNISTSDSKNLKSNVQKVEGFVNRLLAIRKTENQLNVEKQSVQEKIDNLNSNLNKGVFNKKENIDYFSHKQLMFKMEASNTQIKNIQVERLKVLGEVPEKL